MKRFYYLFLLFVFAFQAMHANGNYYDVQMDGIFYRLNKKTKEATVVMGCTWSGPFQFNTGRVPSYKGDIVIPDSFVYDGSTFNVTSIEGQSRSLEFVYSYGAFEGCSELTSITIPQSIKSIGRQAFDGCTSLKSVFISDLTAWCNIRFDLYDVYEHYFSNTNPLFFAHDLYLNGNIISNLTIPEEITTIKDGTFIGSSISSVVFHKNVSGIGYKAFDSCNNLTDIYSYSPRIETNESFTSPESKTLHIRKCYNNNYIGGEWSLFGKTEYIEGVDFHLYYYVDGVLYKDAIIEVGEAIIPEPTPSKEGYTFSGWSDIPETMPAYDVTITGTFSPNTYKLTYNVDGEEYKVAEVKYDETIMAEPEPTKKGMTFSGWSEIPDKMPAKDVTVTGTFSWSKKISDKIIYQVTDTINNCAAVIGSQDASGDVAIASDIEFDYNYKVTFIADGSFNGCKGITTINIPATITNIGERAFAKIDKLTDVTILAEEVPTTDRTAFENSYIDYVTLHVPAGSVEKYKAIGPWKNFKEIVPIEGGDPTTVLPIHSVESQKSCYNLNGIRITKASKTAKGIIIRDGKKYYIR